MAYTKHTWTNGEVITADKLNHIEEGIANKVFIVNVEGTDDGQGNVTWETASATSTEIKEAFDNGVLVTANVTIYDNVGEISQHFVVVLVELSINGVINELEACFFNNIYIYEDGAVNKQEDSGD